MKHVLISLGVIVCVAGVAYLFSKSKQATFEILEWYVTDDAPGSGWATVPDKTFVVVTLQIHGEFPGVVYSRGDGTFEVHPFTFCLATAHAEFHGEGFGTDDPSRSYGCDSMSAVDLRPPPIVFIVDRPIAQQEMAIKSSETTPAALRPEKRKAK